MRIEVRIKVFAISREDHDRAVELIDDLWSVEKVFFDEYSNECEIDFGVDEGIEGEEAAREIVTEQEQEAERIIASLPDSREREEEV